jgi:hypothetical protein
MRGNSDATTSLNIAAVPIIKQYISTFPEELNFQTITMAGNYDPQVGALTTGPVTLDFGGNHTLKLANTSTGQPYINFYDYASNNSVQLKLEFSSLTATQQITFPDASGVIALTSQTFSSILSASDTLAFTTIAANTSKDLTINVTGATVGSMVLVSAPTTSYLTGLTISAFVLNENVVTIRIANSTSSTTPTIPSGVYTVKVLN